MLFRTDACWFYKSRQKINVPERPFYKNEFRYNKERDVYICPAGFELSFRNRAEHHGRVMKLYKTTECANCQFKSKCTRNPRGRIIYRWEYEEILKEMKKRVENNREKVKRRQWLVEHPFGTLKRAFNQGYMLMRGIEKVAGEISLSILAYNIKRVINIVGLKGLILAL